MRSICYCKTERVKRIITSWIACSQVPAQFDHCQVTGQLPKKQKEKERWVHTIMLNRTQKYTPDIQFYLCKSSSRISQHSDLQRKVAVSSTLLISEISCAFPVSLSMSAVSPNSLFLSKVTQKLRFKEIDNIIELTVY